MLINNIVFKFKVELESQILISKYFKLKIVRDNDRINFSAKNVWN